MMQFITSDTLVNFDGLVSSVQPISFQDRGVPRGMGCTALRPSTSRRFTGAIPSAGRMQRTLWRVKRSPFSMSWTTKRLRMNLRDSSLSSESPKSTRPTACSATRIASTIALNSRGSMEKAASGPSDRLVEDEVFFDHRSSQGYGSDCDSAPFRMIRESHAHSECTLHVRDHRQVHLGREGRVGGGAVQQYRLHLARAAEFHGCGQLGQAGDPRRENHGLALSTHVLYQFQVIDLEGSDLVCAYAEP